MAAIQVSWMRQESTIKETSKCNFIKKPTKLRVLKMSGEAKRRLITKSEGGQGGLYSPGYAVKVNTEELQRKQEQQQQLSGQGELYSPEQAVRVSSPEEDKAHQELKKDMAVSEEIKKRFRRTVDEPTKAEVKDAVRGDKPPSKL